MQVFSAAPRLPYGTPMLQQFPKGVVKHIFPPHIEAQRAAALLNSDARDPFLVGFEEFLLKKLRQTDVWKDDKGMYMFNVNQVAYVVEESIAEAQQRATRTRMKKDLPSFNVVRKKCSRTGHGKPSHHPFA
jgi:hypothetical protein